MVLEYLWWWWGNVDVDLASVHSSLAPRTHTSSLVNGGEW
jgi:hypothetical protein